VIRTFTCKHKVKTYSLKHSFFCIHSPASVWSSCYGINVQKEKSVLNTEWLDYAGSCMWQTTLVQGAFVRCDYMQLNCSWESCVSPLIWPERIENPTWALGDAAFQCCWLRTLLPPQLQFFNLAESQNLLFYLVAWSSRQQDDIL
jgi:hypothetical protein